MPQTKPYASIYFTAFTFNGKTYSQVIGGPQGVNVDQGGTNVPFYSGNAQWPVWNPVVEKQAGMTIELSEFDEDIPIGTLGNLPILIDMPDGTQSNLPYYNMRFVGSSAGQGFGRYATRVVRFVFQANNGVGNGPRDTNY
jgi:hypothetical protein